MAGSDQLPYSNNPGPIHKVRDADGTYWNHDQLPYNQQTFHRDRYGLVRAPPDRQYEWPYQTKHPINFENRHSDDDLKFNYNPNKGPNNWPSTHEETYSNTYFYEGTNAGHGAPAANPGTNQGQFAQVASGDFYNGRDIPFSPALENQ